MRASQPTAETINAPGILPLDQLAAAIGAYTPSRSERLQLARIQAEIGMQAIAAGDVGAARAFLLDALHHLDQIP